MSRRIHEAPVLIQAKPLQESIYHADSIGTVVRHCPFREILAGTWPAGFFDNVDFMPQPLKAHEPGDHPLMDTPKRIPYHRGCYYDARQRYPPYSSGDPLRFAGT